MLNEMLNEISQTERQILYGIVYTWNLKESNSLKQRLEWHLTNARGWRKWKDVGQKVQTSSCKISPRDLIDSTVIAVNNTVIHLKIAKSLKSAQKKKW